MKAEIISVGTELLLGEITDTNAPYLARYLAAIGVEVYWISQVGDNQTRLVDLLSRAWTRSDLIVTTGGIGPTEDDLTREAIAEYLGEEIKIDTALEERLRAHFAKRGFVLTPNNLKQATLIPSARALPNPRGSAPGWLVEKDGHMIITMPGVPAEMYRMWEEEALPVIRKAAGEHVIISRHLKLVGIGESTAEYRIKALLSSRNPTIAPYAKDDGVHLRLTAKAGNEEKARALIASLEAKVRAILGEYIYAVDAESPEEMIGKMLQERGLTVGTMESATGGQLATTITNVAGSSHYFRGGMVVYSSGNITGCEALQETLTAHGQSSREASEAMATSARQLLAADVGIGLAGAAGPEGFEGNEPGTIHVAVDFKGEVSSMTSLFPTSREAYKVRAVLSAINFLRTILLKEAPEMSKEDVALRGESA
ncbi:MAG: competence/damage-inducible protein A [Chloroflexi bacterium]|nr:competence/damage-inducible protein A [Chloroflexota bacterium]